MAKILEIEFQGGRKAFYANPQEFPFLIGDMVVVQAERGEDMGMVVNMGSLVDKRAGTGEFPQIIRKPSKEDLKKHKENKEHENLAFQDCKRRIEEHGLDMKLVGVEYQFDRNKITFYFTSEKRVDFRALVRDLAARYRTRIELRQIGVRDEAKRIGGVGVCGRKLCCRAFLREFEPIVTQYAKEQNLSPNPSKLSGACGRLMCCLRYEHDYYSQVMEKFPDLGTKIKTEKGTGVLKRVEVLDEVGIIEYENQEEARLALGDLDKLLETRQRKKKKKKKKKKKGNKETDKQV